MRVSRISVESFRAIRQADVAISPFTVIVGPNGAGKSSLLESLRLFSCLERPDQMSQDIARWGGFQACVFSGATDRRIRFEIEAQDGRQTLTYALELQEEGAGFFVNLERLTRRRQSDTQAQELYTRSDSTVTSAWGADKNSHSVPHGPTWTISNIFSVPEVSDLATAAKRISLWQLHKFLPTSKVRAPQQLLPADIPLADGSNLFSVLYSLRTDRRQQYNELLASLKAAVPELDELDFPLAGAGHVSLAWRQSNFPQPFYSNQLSDGTLRFLFITTILHTVPEDSLIMLDEPELSLHPQWLMLLVSFLRKTSARANVLVATQSAELIRWLEPEELVIANATDDGTVLARAADKPDLQKWLDDFTLSELWTMGELGGRR